MKEKLLSRVKQSTHSALPIGWHVTSLFLESGFSACVVVAWEDKSHHHKHPSFCLLRAHVAEGKVLQCRISLWSGLPCSLPAPTLPPAYSLLTGGKKSSTFYKCCSASARHWCLISTDSATNGKQSTVQAAMT